MRKLSKLAQTLRRYGPNLNNLHHNVDVLVQRNKKKVITEKKNINLRKVEKITKLDGLDVHHRQPWRAVNSSI